MCCCDFWANYHNRWKGNCNLLNTKLHLFITSLKRKCWHIDESLVKWEFPVQQVTNLLLYIYLYLWHNSDVIWAPRRIKSPTILTACSGCQQSKHQSSALLAICEGNLPETIYCQSYQVHLLCELFCVFNLVPVYFTNFIHSFLKGN